VTNLIAQNMFIITNLSYNKKTILRRWVFKLKPINKSIIQNNYNK